MSCWSFVFVGGGVPQILHEVDVPVLTNENCQEMFQKSGHLKAIRESFICAGYAEGLKDSCEVCSIWKLFSNLIMPHSFRKF